MMTARHDRIQAAIERGNVEELQRLAEGRRCACMGARDGEPLCPCRMTDKQLREAVSFAALKRGKLVRLKT